MTVRNVEARIVKLEARHRRPDEILLIWRKPGADVARAVEEMLETARGSFDAHGIAAMNGEELRAFIAQTLRSLAAMMPPCLPCALIPPQNRTR